MFTSLKRAAVFLLGAYTIVAQVTFVREFLVVFLGNELCLGIIFSSWFMGIALGAAVSARRARGAVAGERAFLSLAITLALISPFVLIVIRLIRSLLSVPPGEYIPFARLLISTWFLIIPFSFFIGLAFPFACLLRIGERGVRNVGRVYVLESLGSIAGGALFSFALVGRVSTVHILCGGSAALCLVLFLLSWEPPRRLSARLVTGIPCAAFFMILVTGAAGKIDALTIGARWRSLNPGLPLVASVESRYENIAVGERAGQYDLFGSGQYYFSFPDPYGYAAVTHVIMSEHPDPRRVLLIGGGVGGMIPELAKYRLELVRYVELDPAIITVTEKFLSPAEARMLHSPPVEAYYGDGRRFVKQTEERFDIVVVNVPDPSTAMLNRFYTREFYEEAKRILAPGGILAARLNVPSDYYGEEVGNYAGSVYRTLKSVFPDVRVTPTEEMLFFAASESGIISSDLSVLQKRWAERGIVTDYFGPNHFLAWWLPERVEFTRKALETYGKRILNTDMKPVTYYFNLILWARYSGSAIAHILSRIENAGPVWYLGLLLVLFVSRLFYIFLSGTGRGRTLYPPPSKGEGKGGGVIPCAYSQKSGKNHIFLSGAGRERASAFHALLAIAAMGFTAMALEIILIFAFQNIYGYVYQMMGLIVALFMAGLATGGFIANTLVRNVSRRWPLWLGFLECALALYLLVIPLIVARVGSASGHTEYLFMALIMITGFITGAGFPISNQIYTQHVSDIGSAAARVNGFDQFGACAGSILTGVIFVPLLGIPATCLFLLTLNGLCGILLLIDPASR
ncbi:MAG: MFS transporter [Candidatus Aureabacteria bacterium]|nr:MFS transporter [Candidatus Auribacterota bacterium]